jgi:hypothetical protein
VRMEREQRRRGGGGGGGEWGEREDDRQCYSSGIAVRAERLSKGRRRCSWWPWDEKASRLSLQEGHNNAGDQDRRLS